MAIIDIEVDTRFRYELDDIGPVLTRHKLDYEGHREVRVPPPSGNIIDLATDDDYLFTLQDNGEVWRSQIHSDNWHQLTQIPLGVTSISTTQDSLQMIHSAGSAISSLKLPGDYGLELTDTAGLNNIIQVEGDERQRAILLNDGSVFIQAYHRGTPELIPTPPSVVEIDIGDEFIYFRDAAGTISRVKDYKLGGFDTLAGITGAASITVSSDHKDRLFVSTAGGTTSVTPETWTGVSIPTGWVVSDWVTSDFVEVA